MNSPLLVPRKVGEAPTIGVVCALGDDLSIGAHGALPWHLPDDLRHFVRLSRGHALIMGRRTWESLAGPLPHRQTIVLTSRALPLPDGVTSAPSWEGALAQVEPARHVIAAGGNGVYAAALPSADVMELTRVHGNFEGDAHFPDPAWPRWQRVWCEYHAADERHSHAFTFERWIPQNAA